MDATLEPASSQATLEGMPSSQAPAQPDHLPRLAVHGVLLGDAQVRTCTNGLPRITALLQQHAGRHPKAAPLLIELGYPDLGCPNSTHQAAIAKAHLLRAGADAIALGHGIEASTHRGEPVLRLINVLDLWAIDKEGAPLVVAGHQPGDH